MTTYETEKGHEKILFSKSNLDDYAYIDYKGESFEESVKKENGTIEAQWTWIRWVVEIAWRYGKKVWKVVKKVGDEVVATRYVDTVIKVGSVNLKVSKHAAQRMAQRGINVRTVEAVIREGERFYDQRERHQSYIAWCKSREIAVALSPKDRWGKRAIKTVMDDVTENEVERKVDRKDWVKKNWRL
ncbi:DUF4258 domain-containing protein [Peptococcaceae bacterium]|nr:DUF4258 domain-containing protein [Peptococcaceae bacterium]